VIRRTVGGLAKRSFAASIDGSAISAQMKVFLRQIRHPPFAARAALILSGIAGQCSPDLPLWVWPKRGGPWRKAPAWPKAPGLI